MRQTPLVALLGLIFAVHVVVACVSRDGAIRDDAESYVLIARNLAAGHGFAFHPASPPTSWRAPGYPLLLAAVFALTGGSLLAARLVHALLWTLAALAAYRLARALALDRGRPQNAWAVAAVTGLYPEFVGMTGLLWSENLTISLLLVALLAVVTAVRQRRSLAGALGAGLLVGLAALTRSTVLALLPAILALGWLGRPDRRCRWLAAAAVLAAGATVGLWTGRNLRVHGVPILVESNLGYNLYVGNCPDTPVPFAWQRARRLPADARYQRLIAGRSEAERYRALTQAALAEIRRDPLAALRRAAGKTFDFWLPDFFVARNARVGALGGAVRRIWPAILAMTVATSLLAMGAALVRAWQTRAEWQTQWIVLAVGLYMLPHLATYGASRYRLPVMPLLLLLAAPLLAEWWERGVRRPRRKPATRPAAAIRFPRSHACS